MACTEKPRPRWILKCRKKFSRDTSGAKPRSQGRAADYLEPELEKARAKIGNLAKDDFDLLIYALYPTTGEQFLKWKYGLEPRPASVKPKTLEDIKKEDAAWLRLWSKCVKPPCDQEGFCSALGGALKTAGTLQAGQGARLWLLM